MNKCGIEEIEQSLDLPVGARFYLHDTLLEVAEIDDHPLCRCSKCKFQEGILITAICYVMNCDKSERHDGKYIYFKEVKEIKEEPAQLQIQKKNVGNGAYRNANNSNNIESIKID